MGTTSTTQIELGGLTADAQHDQLNIAGTANLDGTLQLAPYSDPATRGTADDFTIITAGSRSGTFSTVQYDGSTLAPDFETAGDGSFRDHVAGGLFRSVTYTSTAVSVQNLLASEGDTDGDLDVDTVDLTGMIMNYTGATGSGTTWLTGDTDGDGDTDTVDLTTAIINFTSARNAAAVPEPSGLLLLVLAAGCLAVARDRNCGR